eukprot:m.24322 g.24322  ORF g.24322 m.24322 type:complete len:136 (+) comp11495_c0_seq1:188-595(+)
MARGDANQKKPWLKRVASRLRLRRKSHDQSAKRPDRRSTSDHSSFNAPPSLADTSRLSQESLKSFSSQPSACKRRSHAGSTIRPASLTVNGSQIQAKIHLDEGNDEALLLSLCNCLDVWTFRARHFYSFSAAASE